MVSGVLLSVKQPEASKNVAANQENHYSNTKQELSRMYTDSENTVFGSSASWVWTTEELRELIENSCIIGIGTVINSYTAAIGNVVFTYNIVRFENIYMVSSEFVKTTAPKHIEQLDNGILYVEVLQTGGTYSDITTVPFDEAPLYEIGKSYLFLLNETDDGHFLPVGGFQGYAHLVDGRIVFPEQLKYFSDSTYLLVF